MKKKIIALFFIKLCINFSVFAKEITIDEIFSKIEKEQNSYIAKLYKTNQESIENKIRENKLGDFNGLEFSSNFSAVENYSEERLRKYDKTLQNRLSYGNFYLNYNYVENKNNYVSYGIEKNLKNLFYSPYSSQLKINNLNQNLNEIEYLKNMEDRKLRFLEIYQDILNSKDELNYRKEAKRYYEAELKKVKTAFDLGMEAKISYESAELELEEINLKIDMLNKKINSLYEMVKNEYDIDLENLNLLALNYLKTDTRDNITKYKNLELRELELNSKILEERVKYKKYDSFMPDLILGYERIDKVERYGRTYKGENVFSAKFSKKLFSSDSEYKNLKLDEENAKDKLVEKRKNLLNERLNLNVEYENLEKSVNLGKKKLEIAKKRYDIKRKEYELARASYLDVIDEYNKYLAQEIETKKVSNELNAFKYKIAIKAKYEVESEENYK